MIKPGWEYNVGEIIQRVLTETLGKPHLAIAPAIVQALGEKFDITPIKGECPSCHRMSGDKTIPKCYLC